MPISEHRGWETEKTLVLPAYRILMTGGDCGPMVHVTPDGYHVVDMDCDGICLVCDKPLVSTKSG